MRITNVPNTYVPQGMASKILNEEIRKKFGTDELIVIMLNIKKDDVFFLEVKEFISDLKKIEEVSKVKSIFSYEFIQKIGEDILISPIFEIDKVEESYGRIKKDADAKRLFINFDSNVMSIFIEPIPIESSVARSKLLVRINDLINKHNLREDFRGFAGEFIIDVTQFNEMIRMVKSIVPLSVFLGFLLLYVMYRSIRVIVLIFFTNLMIVNCCLSIYTFFNLPYNMLSSMLPNLILAINISFFIHLLNSVYYESFNEKNEMLISLKKVRGPALISALTTAFGFFALAFSPVPAVSNLGGVVGFGVLLSYFIIYYLAADILIFFKVRLSPASYKIFNPLLDLIVRVLNYLFINVGRNLIILILLFGLLIIGIKYVKTESNLYMFFKEDHAVNLGNSFFQKNFTGSTMVDIVLRPSRKSLISENVMSSVEMAVEKIKLNKQVGNVFSYTNIISDFHHAFSGVDNEKINEQIVEQYLFIYDGEDLYDFISNDLSVARIAISLKVQGANEIEEELNKIESILEDTLSDDVIYSITGQGKILSDQENLLMNSFLKGFALSFITIFIVIWICFKSFFETSILMIPNVAPVVATFSMMGFLNIWLDFGTAMISSVTLGIAVDDTIHMFYNIKKYKKEMLLIEAIKKTMLKNGISIIMTTGVLNIQFLLLCFSDFQPLKNFGLLTFVGLTVALFFDLFFLPCALVFFEKTRLRF